MTRVKISVAVILGMIICGILSGTWVNGRCRRLEEKAQLICAAVEKGDKTAAVGCAEDFSADWEDFKVKAAVMLKYDRLFEIDRLAAHLDYLAEKDDKDILPELAELTDMLDALRRNEVPFMRMIS